MLVRLALFLYPPPPSFTAAFGERRQRGRRKAAEERREEAHAYLFDSALLCRNILVACQTPLTRLQGACLLVWEVGTGARASAKLSIMSSSRDGY